MNINGCYTIPTLKKNVNFAFEQSMAVDMRMNVYIEFGLEKAVRDEMKICLMQILSVYLYLLSKRNSYFNLHFFFFFFFFFFFLLLSLHRLNQEWMFVLQFTDFKANSHKRSYNIQSPQESCKSSRACNPYIMISCFVFGRSH